MSSNLYLQAIEDIKRLVGAKDFENAKKRLLEELSMPYTPSEYEKTFKELLGEVESELSLLKPAKIFDVAQLLPALLTDDKQKKMLAISAIFENGISSKYFNLIEEALMSKKLDRFESSSLILALAENKVSNKFKYLINNEEKEIIPSSIDLEFHDQVINSISKQLHDILFKLPSLLQIADLILKQIWLYYFPLFIPKEYDVINDIILATKIMTHEVENQKAPDWIDKILSEPN